MRFFHMLTIEKNDLGCVVDVLVVEVVVMDDESLLVDLFGCSGSVVDSGCIGRSEEVESLVVCRNVNILENRCDRLLSNNSVVEIRRDDEQRLIVDMVEPVVVGTPTGTNPRTGIPPVIMHPDNMNRTFCSRNGRRRRHDNKAWNSIIIIS